MVNEIANKIPLYEINYVVFATLQTSFADFCWIAFSRAHNLLVFDRFRTNMIMLFQ